MSTNEENYVVLGEAEDGFFLRITPAGDDESDITTDIISERFWRDITIWIQDGEVRAKRD